ncbi:MAG: lamin tail domain-containing protein, partial [Candidatus Aenigmarchaeota archaeon]|nr:lamin tail domain-containing protein [Candidatus Aenigmarchaeota archaeon]
ACPDNCLSDADCPRGTGCSAYICRGSPKTCEKVVLVPCCGDGRCEGGENSTCPSDCPAQQSSQNNSQQQSPPNQNQTGNQTSNQTTYTYYANITITNITYLEPEFVVINNIGNGSADMINWTLNDNTTLASHIFTFPDFILGPNSYVKVHTEAGTNNATDLFWGKGCPPPSAQCIWNNDHDTGTLKDSNGSVISVYAY